ncbi:hypothetical protein PPYR_04213 [Photinus pyralis]|uniref:Uncharacterized protein n=1 Tax=Photinus pyralis TaxID=7054 RepID=A0A1Y1N5K5_PHOPY|nr:uncharacterized protein LOC116165098 [Photinus pyralis]KAB0802027.1 hypothetical protein PPYR_04213 [Photinus pyralis]
MYYICVLLNTFFGILIADSASNGNIDISNQKVTKESVLLPFPTDSSKYVILNVTAKPGKIAAVEVDDLLHGGLYANISHHTEMQKPALVINVIEEKNSEKLSDIKWDTELIEDGTNTEDKRVRYVVHTSSKTHNLVSHQLPLALTISAVVIVIITGSVAYFTWRKFEYRCRRRELLINRMDPDDMRHFSI